MSSETTGYCTDETIEMRESVIHNSLIMKLLFFRDLALNYLSACLFFLYLLSIRKQFKNRVHFSSQHVDIHHDKVRRSRAHVNALLVGRNETLLPQT